MTSLIEFLIPFKYFFSSALITTILLYVFTNYKNILNNKKIISGFIFAISFYAIFFSVSKEVYTNYLYDGRIIYLSFIALNFNIISILISAVLIIIGLLFILEGSLIIFAIITVLLPIIVFCLYNKYLKQFLFKSKYSNKLLIISFINLIIILSAHFIKGISIQEIIVLILLNPLLCIVNQYFNEQISEYNSDTDKYLHNNKILSKALDSTKEFEIYILDLEYKYLYYNKYHIEQMRKFNNYDFKIGDNFLEKVENIAVRNRLKKNIDLALLGKRSKETLLVEDGNENYLEEHYIPVFDENKKVKYVSVFSHNVSKQVNYEKQINFLSNYDSLTKLLNRRSLINNSENYDNEKNLVIIFYDVNNLKFINDVFGHLKGDYILNIVANELNKEYQDYANIYRIGGDEFIVTYTNKKQNHLEVAKKVKERIKEYKINNIPIMVSYGVAVKKNKETFNELLDSAETIMYEQKNYYSSKELLENIEIIHNLLLEQNVISTETIKRLTKLSNIFVKPLSFSQNDINNLNILIKFYNIGLIASLSSQHSSEKDYIEIGYRILSSTKDYNVLTNDIIAQYENFDGSGGPQNLSGERISLRARILRIIKEYDRLTNVEMYSKEEAVLKLENEKGKIFDPKLVDIFVNNI